MIVRTTNYTSIQIIGYVIIFCMILVSCTSSEYVMRKRELVAIPAGDIEIKGIMYRPETAESKSPAIIILHGWSQYDTRPVELTALGAWSYAKNGYVSLALSLRGWSPTGGEDDCGGKQPHDVVAAIEWLTHQPGVDSNRLGVLGYSQGGQVALLSAAITDRLKAVVAYFPVIELKKWAETTDNDGIRNWYVPKVCAKDKGLELKSPLYVADKINAPTLLIQGEKDTRVPKEQSIMMANAMENNGKNIQLHLVNGGAHSPDFDSAVWKAANELEKEFFRTHLK